MYMTVACAGINSVKQGAIVEGPRGRGVGYWEWEGVPLSSRLRDLGSVVSSPVGFEHFEQFCAISSSYLGALGNNLKTLWGYLWWLSHTHFLTVGDRSHRRLLYLAQV